MLAYLYVLLSLAHPITDPCVPRWAVKAENAAQRHQGKFSVRGCSLNAEGYVPCSPHTMRAGVESELHATGLYQRPLRLEAYSIARNIASEAGSGSIPEKVGIAEAAVNRARERGMSITALMLRDSRWYARQRGSNPRVASSKNPTLQDIIIADMVLDGETDNFAKGATHYFGPNAQDAVYSRGGTDNDRWDIYRRWTQSYGLAWVGPLPGINPHKQFFMREMDVDSHEPGRLALQKTETAAVLPPICKPSWKGITAAGLFTAGLTFFLYARSEWGNT